MVWSKTFPSMLSFIIFQPQKKHQQISSGK